MKKNPFTLIKITFFVFLLLLFSGCSTNPATGDRSFTGFMTLNDEISIGKKEHPKILKAFGGIYDNRLIKNYVNKIGNHLAEKSELPNIKWTFTVLNSAQVNAFALPGGYIYVTRGLIALASNEAELASVIAHEIGHVTARHTAQRYSSSILAGGISMAADIFFGPVARDITGIAGKATVLSYSRRQEFEADMLGARYLSRGGYNNRATAKFLTKLRSYSLLEAKRLKKDPSKVDQSDIFATHPRTIDRVERAIQTVKNTNPNPLVGTVAYMEKIHNMLYGDDPKEGLIKGQIFIHPKMKFKFRVAENFQLFNYPNMVIAKGPDSAMIRFDIAKRSYSKSLKFYLKKIWLHQTNLSNIQKINVNGMLGITATSRFFKKNQYFTVRFVAIQNQAKLIYRFIFLTPLKKARQFEMAFRQTTYSLKNISSNEAKKIKPNKIIVKAVGNKQTVEYFSSQMIISSFKEQTFRILNGLGPIERLQQGKLVKIVSE